MRKQIVVSLLLAFICVSSYSQILFEKGYFIDEADKRTDCLIKNIDWDDNPVEFQYKLSENDEMNTATIKQVKEFAILGASRYVRANVKIDRSSNEIDEMSTDRNPVFKEEVLFLRTVVDGKATLYSYQEGKIKRYFFKTDEAEIQQLVHKRYRSIDGQIGDNNVFRQQIVVQLKCAEVTSGDAERLQYNTSSLERIFLKYNKCSDPNYVNAAEKKEKRDLFNISVRAGLNISSLSVEETSSFPKSTDFGTKLNPRLGIEAEFILPFNKSKWAITLEPTYQYFKAEESRDATFVQGGVLVTTIDYSSIELPFMLRYYAFLKNESKLFFNAGFVMDLPMKTDLKFNRADGSELETMELSSQANFAFGAGYKFMKRFSLEARYFTDRQLLNKYTYWSTSYSTISFIVGYTF